MAKRSSELSDGAPSMSASKEADMSERYVVPALTRGLNILQDLSGDRRKQTLSEVAATLGVTRS